MPARTIPRPSITLPDAATATRGVVHLRLNPTLGELEVVAEIEDGEGSVVAEVNRATALGLTAEQLAALEAARVAAYNAAMNKRADRLAGA